MNILEEADKIVNHRSQEKEREYGRFNESMDRMRNIFNAMTGLNLKTEHMYDAMIALKLSRESYTHKEDNLLDMVAYIGAKNNYINDHKLDHLPCPYDDDPTDIYKDNNDEGFDEDEDLLNYSGLAPEAYKDAPDDYLPF